MYDFFGWAKLLHGSGGPVADMSGLLKRLKLSQNRTRRCVSLLYNLEIC